MSAAAASTGFRFGFIMEQTLGHVTHYRNMRAAIDGEPTVDAAWYPLTFPAHGALETLPLLRSNWSARSSLRAWRLLARHHAAQRYDALFFHTQVTTLLSAGIMRRVPTIISLDATPLNYDVVGAAYGHRSGGRAAEMLKHAIHRRPLLAAKALVTWCDWARRSLIDDYGIPPERISVIPPGVPLDQWPQPRPRVANGPIRILFVGADFVRKGGEDLLQALPHLPEGIELHLVTKAVVSAAPRVRVYPDIAPNSDVLKHLYATADLFVLPTHADCFPLVIQEAMAAGLPVVASDVGALGEAVQHGITGLLVPPGNLRALVDALSALIADPERRRTMGQQARAVAERRFDSAANARRNLHTMMRLVDTRRALVETEPRSASGERWT